jgi:DNA-binding transcriptional MerR regulator
MSPKTFTTGDAAKQVGITRVTLQAWIKKGKFKAPPLATVGNISMRLWSESDIARLKKAKSKIYQEKKRAK